MDAPAYIDALLARAANARASDLHLEPLPDALEVRARIDGLLQPLEQLPPDLGKAAVLRLMVMAGLLTYRLDIPQEGRIHTSLLGKPADLRLSIMPVAQSGGGGLRAAVRLPVADLQPHSLDELSLPPQSLDALRRFAASDGASASMLLVTGPAGSGKTTTIYALLAHIAKTSPGLSIIALEDPVERLLPGITQIEVSPHGQLTYDRALKSILRQDPQVLMLGEIRDAATASLAIQAALSGHRLIATLHAGDPATAIARLLEMGVEPYQITSALFGVLSQRLVRKRDHSSQASNLKPQAYKGRLPIAEFAALTPDARAAILNRADAGIVRNIFAQAPQHATLKTVAGDLVRQELTDPAEIARVLGG